MALRLACRLPALQATVRPLLSAGSASSLSGSIGVSSSSPTSPLTPSSSSSSSSSSWSWSWSSSSSVRWMSHGNHQPIPRRDSKVSRPLNQFQIKKNLTTWKNQQSALKQERLEHYFATGQWKVMPNIPRPLTVVPIKPPPPSPILTPLDGPYPGYVRVDHPHPLPSSGPVLPNGVSITEMRDYVIARQRATKKENAASEAAAAASAAAAAADEAATPQVLTPVTTEAVLADASDDDHTVITPSSPSVKRVFGIGAERDVLHDELANPGSMFAIAVVNGRQFKMMEHDLIMVSRLPGLTVGDRVAFDRVLLMGTRDYTLVGMPRVSGARVECVVEELTRTSRTIVFHKIRRKGYRRTIGHRDYVTIMRVLSVIPPSDAPPHVTSFPTNLSPELPLPPRHIRNGAPKPATTAAAAAVLAQTTARP